MTISGVSPNSVIPWYCNLDDTTEEMLTKCSDEINKLKKRYDNYIKIRYEEDEFVYVYKKDFEKIKKLFLTNNSFDDFCKLCRNEKYYEMFEEFWGNENVSIKARELLKKYLIDRTIRENKNLDDKYHYYGYLLKDKYGKFLSDYVNDSELYRIDEKQGYVLYEIDLIDYCFDDSNTLDLITFSIDEIYRGNYDKDSAFLRSVKLLFDKS